MVNTEFSQEEKIDYIFEILKKQEARYKRNLIGKWIFRTIVILLILSFYIIILPKLDTKTLVSKYIAPKVSEIIAPLAQETMKSVTSNALSGASDSANENLDVISDKQELIKRIREMQNK
ncbi:MAG: hypothetical protein PHR68_01730 [Candidatus Gracilibacteria bacterium]|nr:hypothetical protein [Candidatus Gracilibacteria bacterium]